MRAAQYFSLRLWIFAALGLAARPGAAQLDPSLVDAPFWRWEHPWPTGYSLSGASAPAPGAAVVAGERGTLLRTTDAGVSWQALHYGGRAPVRVQFVDAAHGWVSDQDPAPSTLYRTLDGGQSWQPLAATPPTLGMYDFTFVTATRGYLLEQAGTGHYLHRTLDGGLTWDAGTTLPFRPGSELLFPTPDTGYVTQYNQANHYHVMRTTDGGTSWLTVTPVIASGIDSLQTQAIAFPNGHDGWAISTCHDVTYCRRTHDSGQSWAVPVRIGRGMPAGQASVSFADLRHGVVVLNRDFLYYTADGGATWLLSSGWEPSDLHLRYGGECQQVQLGTGGEGWAVGEVGRVAYTPDYGATWLERNQRLLSPYHPIVRLETPEPAAAWALNDHDPAVLRTTAASGYWDRIDLPSRVPAVSWPTARLTTGAFPDLDTAYVAGTDSLGGAARRAFLLQTTDGGLSWNRLLLPPVGVATDVRFRDGHRGALLDGAAGRVLTTTNGGQTWQVSPLGATWPLHSLDWADDTTLVVVGLMASAFISTDAGQTWQPFASLASELSTLQSYGTPSVRFQSRRVGSVSSGSGQGYVLATTNGGQTWTNEHTTGHGFSFGTRGEGWLLAGDYRADELLVSADSGRTWQPDPTGQQRSHFVLSAAARADRYNGWLAGYGVIARYSQKMIWTQPITAAPISASQSFAVPFVTTGTFGPAEQNFRVELSNAMGRFRPGQTQIIGQGTASPLLATVPAALPAGSRYRVRVVRADGSVLGTASDQRLTLGVVAPGAAASGFQVFPNPARGSFRVQLPPAAAGGRLTLTDGVGRVVWRGVALVGTGAAVPLAGLPAGTYQVQLTSPDGRVATRPLVVVAE